MGFLGTIGRAIGGGVRGFVSGGPLGAIVGGVRGAVSRPGTEVAMLPPPMPTFTAQPPLSISSAFAPPPMSFTTGGRQGPNLPAGFPGTVPEPGFQGALQRFLPGGQTGYAGAPPGYHVNRAYLAYLRAQQRGKRAQNPFNEQRAKNLIVRNRRMNPLNPDALRRANARQVGAVRLMRRVLRGSGYTITRPRFGAKKSRRR